MNKLKMKGFLQDIYPDIAKEWHPKLNGDLQPDQVKPHSNKYVWWRCAYGHEWSARINNRTSNHTICPFCSHKKPIIGKTDFATLYPNLLAEWDPQNEIDPFNVFPQSNKKASWICAYKHHWTARIDHRVNGQRCPICSGLKPEMGITDLEALYPQVSSLWDYTMNNGLLPSECTPFSHRKVHWKCPKGHQWIASVYSVVKSNTLNPNRFGCPVCSGKTVHPDTCLATMAPELAIEWSEKNKLTPLDVTLCSSIQAWWKCSKCGHEWNTKISNRAYGRGCPACKRFIATPDNCLTALAPDLAAEWDYEKNLIPPSKVSACSNLSYSWICSNGHKWEAVVSNRYNLHHGCPICSGRKVIPGENDLATLRADIAKEWDMEKNSPLTPDAVAPFSNLRVWWCCPVGHSYQTAIATRSHGTGCPICLGRRKYNKKFKG